MKNLLLTTITVYQKFFAPAFHQLLGIKSACRSNPTCTVYAKQVITEYGAGKGLLMSLRRILNCQPYFSI